MGLTVTGEITVFRKNMTSQAGNSFALYSTIVSNKKEDGSYIGAYLDVLFRKGVEVGNKAKINIKNSFMTVNEYKGEAKLKLFVMDFDVVEPGEGQPAPAQDTSFMQIPTDMGDLPFK
jgi:hypothetical protein